jgi:hypothetical protein
MEAHNIFQSILALLALWFGINYLWRDFRYDSFREDIFSLRDELFLYAAKANIDFNEPAYTILRKRMNALLRHGHDLTMMRMILLLITHKDVDDPHLRRWEEAIRELPPSVKHDLTMYSMRTAIFVLQNVVYCSFFRYLIVRPLLSFVEIHRVIETPAVASGVQILESETIRDEDPQLVTA